jgi:hypothetical protein
MAWRVICDRCGEKKWDHQLRKEWTGLMVCSDTCWEARNAQEHVRGRADRQNPPWVRPEPDDVFTIGVLKDENDELILDENGQTIYTETGLEPNYDA